MDQYFTPKEAAIELKINYPALMARIRTGKIKAKKKGWAVLIHKREVMKHKLARKK